MSFMSFTARKGAWGPVLCRLLVGGPDPNYDPDFLAYDPCCMSKADVNFDSFFDRLDSVWALF